MSLFTGVWLATGVPTYSQQLLVDLIDYVLPYTVGIDTQPDRLALFNAVDRIFRDSRREHMETGVGLSLPHMHIPPGTTLPEIWREITQGVCDQLERRGTVRIMSTEAGPNAQDPPDSGRSAQQDHDQSAAHIPNGVIVYNMPPHMRHNNTSGNAMSHVQTVHPPLYSRATRNRPRTRRHTDLIPTLIDQHGNPLTATSTTVCSTPNGNYAGNRHPTERVHRTLRPVTPGMAFAGHFHPYHHHFTAPLQERVGIDPVSSSDIQLPNNYLMIENDDLPAEADIDEQNYSRPSQESQGLSRGILNQAGGLSQAHGDHYESVLASNETENTSLGLDIFATPTPSSIENVSAFITDPAALEALIGNADLSFWPDNDMFCIPTAPRVDSSAQILQKPVTSDEPIGDFSPAPSSDQLPEQNRPSETTEKGKIEREFLYFVCPRDLLCLECYGEDRKTCESLGRLHLCKEIHLMQAECLQQGLFHSPGVIHLLPTCRKLLEDGKCPNGSTCLFGHDNPDVRRRIHQGEVTREVLENHLVWLYTTDVARGFLPLLPAYKVLEPNIYDYQTGLNE